MDLLNPQISTVSTRDKVLRFLASLGTTVVVVAICAAGTIRLGTGGTRPSVFPRSNPRHEMLGAQTPQKLPLGRPLFPAAKDAGIFESTLTAVAAVVVDNETNTVLYKKNATTPRSLASITKLMSALVLVDQPLSWASTTVVLASDIDNSSHHLKPGDRLTLEQLWNVALVGSDNTAIRMLRRASGLGEKDFVVAMNAKARALGLPSARFTDPTGLDSGNIASALDVAKLLKVALAVPRISQTLEQGEYDIGSKKTKDQRRVFSTNLLLTDWVPNSFERGSVIGKTGYIQDSGYNFVVRLTEKGSHSVRVVILGAASPQARFSEARDLGNYAFAHFAWPGDSDYERLRGSLVATTGQLKTE